MQILGFLGIYFDAAVVFVTNSTLLFKIGLSHTVDKQQKLFYVPEYEVY